MNYDKKLSSIKEDYYNKKEKLIEDTKIEYERLASDYREQVLIPFCNKYNLSFVDKPTEMCDSWCYFSHPDCPVLNVGTLYYYKRNELTKLKGEGLVFLSKMPEPFVDEAISIMTTLQHFSHESETSFYEYVGSYNNPS